MSATVDANVLIFASDRSSDINGPATATLERLARGPDIFYLFWPVLMAYLRITTHPSIFATPLPVNEAMANVDSLLALPHVRSPGEDEGFWRTFRSVTADTKVRGNLVTDAHIVALMRRYSVREIWTRDRDFRKFDRIFVHNLVTVP